MSIQKKSYLQKKTGKVITKYFASVWDPANRKSITGPLQLRKKDAVKDEADILKKLEEGKPILSRKNQAPTVEQVYKDWKEYIETIYAVNTYKVYQQWFTRYMLPVFGPERVTGIHTQHISRYLVAMRKKYAPATVNKMLNILVSFFAYCIDIQKLIDINPCAGIKRYPVKPTPKETWDEDTIAEFLNSCEAKESHYYPMFLISLTLGPRPGEVCGLPENGYLRNDRKLQFSRGQTNYDLPSDMKNTGAHRTISIPEFICKAIDRHQAWNILALLIIIIYLSAVTAAPSVQMHTARRSEEHKIISIKRMIVLCRTLPCIAAGTRLRQTTSKIKYLIKLLRKLWVIA